MPAILNTDQGNDWKDALDSYGISPSIDGRGGGMADNVFFERLWRMLMYEWLFIRDYDELRESLGEFQGQCNSERPHQGLDYETPDAVY